MRMILRKTPLKVYSNLNKVTEITSNPAKPVTFGTKSHWSWIRLSPRIFCEIVKYLFKKNKPKKTEQNKRN